MMKKITRRSFLSICGVAAAAAALTACGGAASSTAASSAAASSTAASASSTAALSGNVATGGSTSMKNVIAALTEGFAEIEPDVTISYDPTGSGAGITGATDKTLDIGLSSRALKADETGVTGTIVALDGIAIIVNKDSKVEDLTVDKRNIKLNDVVGVTYRSKNRENYFFFDSEDYVVFCVKETYYRSIDISYDNGIAILTDENDKTIKLAFLDSDHIKSLKQKL